MVRPELCYALEEGITLPGYSAHQAIQAFIAALVSWMSPEEYTVTAAIIEGLCYDGDSAAAADTENLICIAIRYWYRLEDEIASVMNAGKYDRSKCDHADIMQEEGYHLRMVQDAGNNYVGR